MTTFAGWLTDQTERQDAVGALARLWKEISPGRIHGLAGVTKALQDYQDKNGLTWTQEAIRLTTEEYRAWKAHPEAASVHAPAVATQLDRIEHMLRSLCDSLGIPLIAEVPDGPDADVHAFSPEVPLMQPDAAAAINEAAARLEAAGATSIEYAAGLAGHPVVPYIKAEGGMGYRPVSSATRPGSTDDASWARLYELADHNVPEDAEDAG